MVNRESSVVNRKSSVVNREWSGWRRGLLLLTFCSFLFLCTTAQSSDADKALNKTYDFSRPHSKNPQQFVMQSRLVQLGLDGTRKDSTIYTLHIKCTPGKSNEAGDEYTCTRFTVRSNNAPEVLIPALTNWSYIYNKNKDEKDEKGQVFGIDHAKFEGIRDSTGKALPVEKMYHVYNAFIDFHALQLFAEPSLSGKAVQNLKKVGDKVIHFSAFSEPPVNLGKQIKEGSVFKNGEITLEFKGIGMMNKRSCAILGYDSGASSFRMLMEPMPSMQVNTIGSSHYWGDIYKDLKSGWIQKADLKEIVVSETEIAGQPNKVHSVIERSIVIRNTN